MRFCSTLLILLSFCLLGGCVSKGITKPRSEILKESPDFEGDVDARIEAERAEFYEAEKANQERVLAFLRERTSGDVRDANYRIGPGDELEINVFDVPELNISSKVSQAGFVSLPLVGGIEAGGMTESAFTESLRKRLAAFVRNPQVNVAVSHYGSQKVAVIGAVQKPGTYALRKGSNSILELISAAGGTSASAGNFINFIPSEYSGIGSANDAESRARLALSTETTAAANRSLELYLDQVMGTSGNIPLEIPVRGGDMVIVPESGKVMVEGEVASPGSFDLGRQSTLLGALASAGGITTSAKIDEVEVVRDVSLDRKTHLVLNLESIARGEQRDVRLRNGDVVRVPSDSSRRLRNDTFETITKVINFGIGGSVPLK